MRAGRLRGGPADGTSAGAGRRRRPPSAAGADASDRRRGPLVPDHRDPGGPRLPRVDHGGQRVDRGAVVRLGGLRGRLRHRADHQDPAVHRGRRPHRRRWSPPAWSSATAPGPIYAPVTTAAAEPRPVPRGHRAAAADGHDRDPRRPGPAGRHRRGWAVADVPAVAQPGAVRHQGPAVPPGPLVLRVHPALAAVRARLPHDGADHGAHRGGLHPLRLRRAAAPGAGGDAPPRAARTHLAVLAGGAGPRAGRHVLVRPLLAGDQGLHAAHRHHATPTPTRCCRPRRSSRWPR